VACTAPRSGSCALTAPRSSTIRLDEPRFRFVLKAFFAELRNRFT
jgi:hypothetical protein